MSSNDNPAITKKEKALHYGILVMIVAVFVFAIIGSYYAIQTPHRVDISKPVSLELEPIGRTKPLPDYMLEDISPDELEYLKP